MFQRIASHVLRFRPGRPAGSAAGSTLIEPTTLASPSRLFRPHGLMHANSLARRLFLLAALWGALALAAAGVALVMVYRESVERSFDQRLDVYLKNLVGALALKQQERNQLEQPDNMGEPRFELPLSGWYWVVARADNAAYVLASNSLIGEVLPLPSSLGIQPDPDQTIRGYVTGPDDAELRVLEREIVFDEPNRVRVAVAGPTRDLRADISSFRNRTILILSGVYFLLVLSTYLQVRWGLNPIERMRQALFAIRNGEAERLEGPLPSEMIPVAEELNALIEANREVVERARTHVGNLAHALKTPLSVIMNEARAAETTVAMRIVEQAGLMRAHIDHHLERARISAQRRVVGAVTEVTPSVDRLARAMRKINEARGITVRSVVQENLKFRGERQDFEEMLGNLMDNACKWAKSEVVVSVRLAPQARPDQRRYFFVFVDDDGPGLPPDRRDEVGRRGRRLDETVPGTGLGLSIVVDLARLYGGRFALSDSPLGGLRCELVLPAV